MQCPKNPNEADTLNRIIAERGKLVQDYIEFTW